MVDVNAPWTLQEALSATAPLRELGLKWIEEPVWPPEDFRGASEISASGVPVAIGENVLTPSDFTRLIDSRAVDYVQPSIAKIGGISIMEDIVVAANQANVAVAPHSAYFGPGLIATAHVSAALARAPMIERLYCDLTESPFGDWYEPIRISRRPTGCWSRCGAGLEPSGKITRRLKIGDAMKIQQVKTNFVRLPLEESLVGAPPMPGMLREFVTVQVLTDEGIEGIGITTFGGKIVRVLKAAVEEFGELIKGEDPLRTEFVTGKLRAASAPCGPGGVAALAISAIDIALWDIRGKAFSVPLAKLLGGRRDRVPAYASGALTRTTPTNALERSCCRVG